MLAIYIICAFRVVELQNSVHLNFTYQLVLILSAIYYHSVQKLLY